MAKTRRLEVLVAGDASGVQKAFRTAAQEADTFGGKVGKAFEKVGAKLGSIGKGLSVGVTAPLALLGKESLEVAEGVQKASTIIKGTLGQTFEQLVAQTQGVREQWKLSKADVASLSGEIGLLTDNLGLSDQAQQGLNGRLLDAAGVWQALKGIDPANFIDMVSAATRGEYDSLQQLIPSISDAKVEEEALKIARANGRNEASELDKTTAALNFILDETAEKEQLAKEAMEGATGATLAQKQAFEDLQLTIGDKLLPMKTQLFEKAGQLLDRFNQLSPATQGLALNLGLIVAAAGPVLFAISQAITVGQQLGGVFSWLAGPIGVFIGALLLTGDNLRLLSQNMEQVRAAFSQKWKELELLIWQVAREVHKAAEFAFGWVPGVGPKLSAMRREVEDNIRRVTNEIHAMPNNKTVHLFADGSQAIREMANVRAQMDSLRSQGFTVGYSQSTGITARRGSSGHFTERAHGGPLGAGQLALVGERGPELFVPNASGHVVNNRRLRAAAGAGAHGTTVVQNFSPTINVSAGAVAEPDKLVALIQKKLREYARKNGNLGLGRV